MHNILINRIVDQVKKEAEDIIDREVNSMRRSLDEKLKFEKAKLLSSIGLEIARQVKVDTLRDEMVITLRMPESLKSNV